MQMRAGLQRREQDFLSHGEQMKKTSTGNQIHERIADLTWQQMKQEIISDLCQIINAMPTAEYIVAMIQWRAKSLAGIVYQPAPFTVIAGSGIARGMSVIPVPGDIPDHWVPIELPVFPARNGVRLTDDMPVFYFVHLRGNGGNGLVIPGRHDKTGRIQWSGNDVIIDEMAVTLAVAGIMTIEPRQGFD